MNVCINPAAKSRPSSHEPATPGDKYTTTRARDEQRPQHGPFQRASLKKDQYPRRQAGRFQRPTDVADPVQSICLVQGRRAGRPGTAKALAAVQPSGNLHACDFDLISRRCAAKGDERRRIRVMMCRRDGGRPPVKIAPCAKQLAQASLLRLHIAPAFRLEIPSGWRADPSIITTARPPAVQLDRFTEAVRRGRVRNQDPEYDAAKDPRVAPCNISRPFAAAQRGVDSVKVSPGQVTHANLHVAMLRVRGLAQRTNKKVPGVGGPTGAGPWQDGAPTPSGAGPHQLETHSAVGLETTRPLNPWPPSRKRDGLGQQVKRPSSPFHEASVCTVAIWGLDDFRTCIDSTSAANGTNICSSMAAIETRTRGRGWSRKLVLRSRASATKPAPQTLARPGCGSLTPELTGPLVSAQTTAVYIVRNRQSHHWERMTARDSPPSSNSSAVDCLLGTSTYCFRRIQCGQG